MNRYSSEWDRVNLSDPVAIRGLLKFRHEYDLLLDESVDRYGMASNCDLADLSEDVICLYADLDNLIRQAKFNDRQNKVLNMYTYGHSEEDISDLLQVERQSVNRMIDNICIRLNEINNENWKMNYVYWDIKRVNTRFKQCSRCKEWLPMTEEYYSPDVRNRNGLQSICKKCNANRVQEASPAK